MTKLILKNNTYKFLFYLALFTVTFCYPSLVVIDFTFALKCLLVSIIITIILFLINKYTFELEMEFYDDVIKVKTMKSEDIFIKDDIKSVFVEFNTAAEMKSKIKFILKNDETKTYYFSDKCYLSNTYKILENISLFPNFEHDIVGTMPAREIAIEYYLEHKKKMNFFKLYFAALEDFNPVKKILFSGIFVLSSIITIIGLIFILVIMFLFQIM